MGMQPMIYTGRVYVGGGAPMPENIRVTARCNGGSRNSRPMVYQSFADNKGHFSFTFGQKDMAPMDASVNTSEQSFAVGNMLLMMCDIQAAAPGFVPSTMTVQFRSSLDSSEMGKLVLSPIGGSSDMGGIVSAVSLMAPDDAQKEYSKGMRELRDSKVEKAEQHFRKAVERYPKYAVAWHKLAQIEMEAKDYKAARESLSKSMEADPKYVPPFIDMAVIMVGERQWADVQSLMTKAVEADSQHFPNAYFLLGIAKLQTGHPEEAAKSALRAEELDKQNQFPRIHLLVAEVLTIQGRQADAANEYKKYLEVDPQSKDADVIRDRIARLEQPKTAAK